MTLVIALVAWIAVEHFMCVGPVVYHKDSELVDKLLGKTGQAFTIGRHVFIRGATIRQEVARHECAHVRQYRRYTLIGFFLLYWWQMWRWGYGHHPMEVEARLESRKTV